MNQPASHSEEDILENKAPLIEHLKELRKRAFIVIGAWLAALIASWFFAEYIYQFLVTPLANIYAGDANRRLIFTGLTEVFFTYMKVAFFSSFILIFPVLAWHIYRFMAPGLYAREKLVFLPFLIVSPVLFLVGAALVYYFIFPLAWQFFLSFEIGGGDTGMLPIVLEARVSEYLSLVMQLIFAFGLAFQLPVVLALLARAGLIKTEQLRQKRRYAIVVIFIVAAILTPPDIISQIGLAIPLLLLYECSIFACLWMEKKRNESNV